MLTAFDEGDGWSGVVVGSGAAMLAYGGEVAYANETAVRASAAATIDLELSDFQHGVGSETNTIDLEDADGTALTIIGNVFDGYGDAPLTIAGDAIGDLSAVTGNTFSGAVAAATLAASSISTDWAVSDPWIVRGALDVPAATVLTVQGSTTLGFEKRARPRRARPRGHAPRPRHALRRRRRRLERRPRGPRLDDRRRRLDQPAGTTRSRRILRHP